MLLTYFYRPLRIMLQDFDSSVRKYPDTILADGVRSAILLNKVPDYALTPAEDEVTPEPDANNFALITYHTARLFVMGTPDRYSFATRGFKESIGSLSRFLSAIEADIHEIENGTAFSGYQSFYSWLNGMQGLPLGAELTAFNITAPLFTVTLTGDGVSTA